MNRDVVVIGSSAGGLEVIAGLLAALPEDLPAKLFIVQHVGPTSYLAQVLAGRSRLPVREATPGTTPENGCVYVAPPDRHLLLHDGHVLLRRGPRENLARPAVDALFRSAACSFGSRVVGIVLSGALNDGTAGLDAVKRGGGIAIVQDPEDAAVPEMPASALRHVAVDHCLAGAELHALLPRLVRKPAGPSPRLPAVVCLEAAIAAQAVVEFNGSGDVRQEPSGFTCPECGGPLWEVQAEPLRYRCRIGHALTAEAMAVVQAEQIDRRLSELLQAHQQRAVFARRRAEAARRQGRGEEAERLVALAVTYDRDAELTARFISDWSASTTSPGTTGSHHA